MSTPTLPVVAGPARWERMGGHAVGPLARGADVRRARARRAVPTMLLFSDAVGVAASVLIVAWVLPSAAGFGSAFLDHYDFGLVSWAVTLTVLAVKGTYSSSRRHIAPRVADGLAPLVVGLATAGLCLLSIDAVGPLQGRVPAGDVALVLLASLVLVPVCRSVGILAASTSSANVMRVVVVGSDEVARSLVKRLARSRLVEVVGAVDDRPADGEPVIGTVEELPWICEDRHVDRVVIAFSQRHPARSAQVLLALHGGVDIDVVARYYELVSWESRLSDVTGLSLVSIRRPPGRGAAAAKRLLDVVVAAAALAVLSPLLLAVAVAIRLESDGPVLFRQIRVGRERRPFRILKFRTMRQAAAPSGARSPLDVGHDPDQVTVVGRLLRRSGIDELPQLVNVLRGEMSVVGPRPFVPLECTGLRGWSVRRFDVRPGMTGMWQVCGQHELSFDELCRLDVQYATSWSLRSDLRILARTPGRLLHGSAPER